MKNSILSNTPEMVVIVTRVCVTVQAVDERG